MTEDQSEQNTTRRLTKGRKDRKNKKAGKHGHSRNRKAGPLKSSADNVLPIPPLDEATVAALTLFNTYMEADREHMRHKQKIRKAENLKKDIATKIRRLQENKGSTEELEKAKSAYREAVEDLNRLQETPENNLKKQETSESEPKNAEDNLKNTEAAKTSEDKNIQGETSENSSKSSSDPQQNA